MKVRHQLCASAGLSDYLYRRAPRHQRQDPRVLPKNGVRILRIRKHPSATSARLSRESVVAPQVRNSRRTVMHSPLGSFASTPRASRAPSSPPRTERPNRRREWIARDLATGSIQSLHANTNEAPSWQLHDCRGFELELLRSPWPWRPAASKPIPRQTVSYNIRH